ncbi:hypothetical protein BC939DRAFT_210094 [Gamsiella multidivaricata]|uniref:uncharacterized protein n=1 Tax=Gamsiella multidivaricata TaxID=101098 RepID=UPI002220CF2C|nr:uncharacterized protein BC939DRAFT_210094 [Gamsiella multidivaricata]KAI7821216.1 hypothetical protein BC939DRAFT_210094 [Gamsiella multidivaricata]
MFLLSDGIWNGESLHPNIWLCGQQPTVSGESASSASRVRRWHDIPSWPWEVPLSVLANKSRLEQRRNAISVPHGQEQEYVSNPSSFSIPSVTVSQLQGFGTAYRVPVDSEQRSSMFTSNTRDQHDSPSRHSAPQATIVRWPPVYMVPNRHIDCQSCCYSVNTPLFEYPPYTSFSQMDLSNSAMQNLYIHPYVQDSNMAYDGFDMRSQLPIPNEWIAMRLQPYASGDNSGRPPTAGQGRRGMGHQSYHG